MPLTYCDLPPVFHAGQLPTPVADPQVAVWNAGLATSLGLAHLFPDADTQAQCLSGNRPWPGQGQQALAQAYAGHQFGHFTLLGDGRAVLLAEHLMPSGQRVDIQLKGSGPTPYSRNGDGRATLPAMLREYIISEAMAALGIPTTRSLAVVTTGEGVQRETVLPGAVLTRIASSHIRVGTFQFAQAFASAEDLNALTQYAIQRHYPECEAVEPEEATAPYIHLLTRVIERQAALIAQWQCVGFIHGVMNTDNMSIAGETIDYGPCAWMDEYHPNQVFSSIDRHGRYAYSNQPAMALWNLCRLAEALLPLWGENTDAAKEALTQVLEGFEDCYQVHWLSGMAAKLGIANPEAGDKALIDDLLGIMAQHSLDFTNSFRSLAFLFPEELPEVLPEHCPPHWQEHWQGVVHQQAFQQWLERWHGRLALQLKQPNETNHTAKARMDAHNPWVIPRNHQVAAVLNQATHFGNYAPMHQLLQALSTPFTLPSGGASWQIYTQLPTPEERVTQTFCGT